MRRSPRKGERRVSASRRSVEAAAVPVVRRVVLLGVALGLLACEPGARTFEAPVELGGVPVAPEVLNRGEMVYMRVCRGCHGPAGRGDGPYAASMEPRPADLTRGLYPRIGVPPGELPSDAQLRRVIVEGIEGTPMGPQRLDGEDLEGVLQYTKTLAPVWRPPSE